MKKIKLLFILALVGMLLIGCKGKAERVQEQLDLGSKYMAELDYESAIVALNKAIKIDPKNVDAYKMLAEVYEKSGRLDDARATLEKVLDLDDLSSENKDEINDRIKNLDFLVAISKLPGEYDEPTALELSNAKNFKIYYTVETENNKFAVSNAEYIEPILFDEDGTYIVTTHTTDENNVEHDEAKVKYVVKLKAENTDKQAAKKESETTSSIEVTKGWKQVGDDWYYIKDDGEFAKGVLEEGKKEYYFDDNGKLVKNQLIKEKIEGSDAADMDILSKGEAVDYLYNYADVNGQIRDVSRLLSYGNIIDKGNYYEVTDVQVMESNQISSSEFKEESVGTVDSIKIRKDAKVIVYGVEDSDGTETWYYPAEAYYKAAGGKLAADSNEEVFELSSNMSIVVFDADGYIIEYSTTYYPSPDSNNSGNDGLVIVKQ
ncbi:MAG: tetratricopeptide repeat protein [Lachnospiraceae bacterium oral taxon 082]|nr:tetratricopeptide repeat protein [Lachnospiraceae bacterium oral taxon 082]